jgi:Protein of unknown function (DUF3017)
MTPDGGAAGVTQSAANQPDPAVAAPQQAPRRRIDPLAAVAGIVAVGVLIAAMHHPRDGMFVACAGLALGAGLRLVLSPRNAGSLVVRNRRVDVVVLASLAVALGVLAAVTPFPAGQG